MILTPVWIEALLGERPGCFFCYLFVRSTKQSRQRLEYRDIGAEPPPYTAQLESDHAGAGDSESFRHLRERERAGIVEYQRVVKIRAGQCAGARTGGDDHVFPGQYFLGLAGNLDFPASGAALHQTAAAVEGFDLVLLEQETDAVVVLGDDFLLAREHPRKVEAEPLHLYAMLGEAVRGMFVVFGGLQERLRRDAADVGARAAQRRFPVRRAPIVDAGGPEPQLRGANRGDITAGTSADHHYVKCLCHLDLRV